MIGRRAIVGFSLMCAFLFCALAAQSASAANTTAVTCVKESGVGQFADAHCGTAKVEGNFAHQVVSVGKTIETELTNEKTRGETKESTSSLLAGELAGIKIEIVCKKVSGTGTLVNEQSEAKTHAATGTMLINQTECTVMKPSGCTVKEPLTYDAKFAPYEKENEKGKEMGLELTPRVGTQMGSFTFEGKECALGGKTFGIGGSFGMTLGNNPEGKTATLTFYTGIGSLTWGGKPYTLEGTITLQPKGGGSFISFTTAT
jgi:hypothetical protein